MRDYVTIEGGLLILLAYLSYLIAEVLQVAFLPFSFYFSHSHHQLSGIVSVLSCGIVIANYTYFNLTVGTFGFIQSLFDVMAYVFEVFIFLYLVRSLFNL
jgi:sodium/hydrogen exchanger 8